MVSRRILAACAVLALVLPALDARPDGDSTRHEVAADGVTVVSIEAGAGRVEVEGWDESRVLAEIAGGGLGVGLDVERRGARLAVDAVGPSALRARVPAGVRVEVSTTSGAIEVTGLVGAVSIETLSGAVRVDGRPADVVVDTVGGTVSVPDGADRITIETVGGAVELGGRVPRARIESVNAAIAVRPSAPVERLEIEAVTGRVDVAAAFAPGARVDLESHAGAVRIVLLGAATALAGRAVTHFENRIYQDEIIYAATSRYQRIVVTRWRADVRLYLDGHLQFSSVDEYRYHEALVHPAMQSAARRERVLILGGGDGLAAREVLRYPAVRSVDLVDLDPAVTELCRTRRIFTDLNDDALSDPRVEIHHADAFGYLRAATEMFDVIIIDLPDPSAPDLAKLYSQAFYGLARRRLTEGGALVSQCTSPFRSRSAFWCIVRTMEAARNSMAAAERMMIHPYHAYVPTFGTWGFCLWGPDSFDPGHQAIPVPTRFLSADVLPGLFVFPPDLAEVEVPINLLNDPVVSRLYRRDYHRYFD